MAPHVKRGFVYFFFSSRRRHTRCGRDWSSDVCSSDLSTGGRVFRSAACAAGRTSAATTTTAAASFIAPPTPAKRTGFRCQELGRRNDARRQRERALFVGFGLVGPPVRAQEQDKLFERLELREPQPVLDEGFDGLPEELLRLFIPALGGADEAERHSSRPDRELVLGPDRLDRLQRKALGLVDLSARDERLGEEALRLAEVTTVSHPLERAHCIAQHGLGLFVAPDPLQQAPKVDLRGARPRDVADVGVELEQLVVAALRRLVPALDLVEPCLRAERGGACANAAA